MRRELYDGAFELCAYSAQWIPFGQGASVDHFQPKSYAPTEAYEWANFRLTTPKLNSYKGESTDIIDPVGLPEDIFRIDFTTFHIEPNPAATMPLRQAVVRTVVRLRLNTDDQLVNQRIAWLKAFVEGGEDRDWLYRKAPFLAREVTRQNAEASLRRAFNTRRR